MKKLSWIDVIFTGLSILSMAFFLKALSIKFHQFFVDNTNMILIISGIGVFVFLAIGKISGNSVKKNQTPEN